MAGEAITELQTFEALRPDSYFIRPARMTVHLGAPRIFKNEPDEREGWDRIARALEEDVRALGGEQAILPVS